MPSMGVSGVSGALPEKTGTHHDPNQKTMSQQQSTEQSRRASKRTHNEGLKTIAVDLMARHIHMEARLRVERTVPDKNLCKIRVPAGLLLQIEAPR
jgi:hypothetical protein